MPTKPKGKITGKEKVGTGPVEQTSADLAADYQWSIALLNSSPELKHLFRQAIKNGWTSSRYAAELQDTGWFKKHAASWRTNEVQRITDPATWNAARKANQATARDTAAAMGAVLTDAQLKKISDTAMAFGWNDAQMRDAMAGYVKEQRSGPLSGAYAGQAGQSVTAIRQAAVRNGYTIPRGKLDMWAASIARGDSTVEDYSQMMRRSAATAYPALKDELLAGADLDDLAAPYRDSMSKLLEIPPDQVKLDDRALRGALSVKDAKGNYSTMPLYDFEDSVRKDARWQYTDNAKQSIMSQVAQLGAKFGRTGNI